MTQMITLPPVHKRAGNWQLNTYETACVTLDGVTPLTITFDHAWSPTITSSEHFTVRNLLTGEVLARKPWVGGLGCAIVVEGVIHVFGSTNWGANGNAIVHSTLDAAFNPSPPVVVHQCDAAYRVLNTDVTATPYGYAMTIETADAANGGVYFLTSCDLLHWAGAGAPIHQGQYCACPSIDYVNGFYYLTYLSHKSNGDYVTEVSRSPDLATWQDFAGSAKYPAYICLLAPTPAAGEGNNASDVSMVECDGKVYGVYLIGDQITYGHLRTFVYFGTMAQLFGEFF